MNPSLRIIRPSSRETQDLLQPRLAELAAAGFTTRYDDLPVDPQWTYAASSAKLRAEALQSALTEEGTAAVLCARGGYGASDILPRLDWQQLARARPKLLVGFSDISALHSGLYGRLGWPSLHAPMPATTLWRQNSEDDVNQLLAGLKALHNGDEMRGSLPLTPINELAKGAAAPVRLFGGCFSVLTNLIGTPYFPRTLAGHVVFLEDTDETPARLLRAFNQWLQSGVLAGATGLVVGSLRRLGGQLPDSAPFVLSEFASRAGLAVWHSPLFGHTSPNLPLAIGAAATLTPTSLDWRLSMKDHSL